MEHRARRWLAWSSIVGGLTIGLIGAVLVMYWYVVWPIPARWVVASSPWLEPQMRAYVRSGFRENLRGERVRSHGNEAFPILLAHLRSTDQDMRRAAVRFLLEFVANREPVPQELIDELILAVADPDPEIAGWACYGVGWLPSERAKPVLKRVLSDRRPSHFWAHVAAMRALAASGDSEVVPWIVPYLSDSLPGVRIVAVKALKEVGDPSADQEVDKLAKDPDPNVRKSVDDYFGR